MVDSTLEVLVHGVMTSISKGVFESEAFDKTQIEDWAGYSLQKQVSEKHNVVATGIERWELWEKQMNTCSVQDEFVECSEKGIHYHLYSYCDGYINE